MRRLLNLFQQTHAMSSTAKVVNDKIILSFPDAERPVVWQMDFSSAPSSAIEIESDDKKGLFTLLLETPDNDKKTIASFRDIEQARHALLVAATAMENAHIHSEKVSGVSVLTGQSERKSFSFLRFFTGIAGLALILFLVMQFFTFTETPVNGITTGTTAYSPDETGVPLSADEFLKRQ